MEKLDGEIKEEEKRKGRKKIIEGKERGKDGEVKKEEENKRKEERVERDKH